jgi:glucosamine 6-phosphate synthetase-like amidotransferase/phosphosugar isomerase protein
MTRRGSSWSRAGSFTLSSRAGKGHTFTSQTDSEVLIHLIGELYQGNLVEAVCAALKHVEGTYGIAVVSAEHPDEFVVALQLFAYHMARLRQCSIDQPRNLVKSVTVE